MPTTRRPRVLVLNRSYWPDVEATGQLLTELCEDLARDCDVTVIAGRPNHTFEQASPVREERNGVEIVRVQNRRYSKTSLMSRAIGLSSYLLLTGWRALNRCRPDVVIAESDPPALGLLGAILRRWHRCPCVHYLQDLHPEVGLALGRLRPGALTTTLWAATQAGLRAADRVVVLGQDMRRRVLARGVPAERIDVVPNWADTTAIRPGPVSHSVRTGWGVGADRFVVLYSGNLGLSQNLDQVLDAAHLLRREPMAFVLAGEGASKERLQSRAVALGLDNVRFAPYAPKERLGEALGAADLHLVTLQAGLAGYIVPSKLYGILAAGRAYVAAVEGESEVAELTAAHACGLRVPPDSPVELAEAIRRCAADPIGCARMGERGRALAVREFDRSRAADRFRSALCAVLPPRLARSLSSARSECSPND